MNDPYEHFLDSPRDPQDQYYAGFYVVPWDISNPDRPMPNVILKMKRVREGGMREFYDPVTGEFFGSCGCNWAIKNVRHLGDFLRETPSD